MRIDKVSGIVLEGDIAGAGFGWSQRTTSSRQAALAVVESDNGLSGVGEAFYFGGPARIAAGLIEGALAPLIIGEDPLDTRVLWDRMYNLTRDQGQKGVVLSAISAIDIALWDLKGKALGLPVYKLLGGGYRRRARCYATGLYEPLGASNAAKALAEEAQGYVAQGFGGMKLKVGYGIERDLEYIAAVRDAIGPDTYLMVDANHGYNVNEALRLIRRFEGFDIHWFEEPVVPEDVDGYREIKSRSEVAIAGGECEYTRYGFRHLIDRRAVDILQPDLCAAGGFSELMNIIALASAAHLPLIPHVWGTNIGLAASLQLHATIPHLPERRFPDEPWFELDRSAHPFRDRVSVERFVPDKGYLDIPDRPGIGITLDEEFIAAHARPA
ncbi:mandelate racemase/muconate lactonizing enzyme family protein [Thioalkalivibrio sp. HK1]|uniref:mandelate racemase/muconate lactonizing enzyme family protein n=1 Tax=Thioalkalivibrio sp. HK1 TaxID=1469245 RepID=UPI000470D309|nr:mandelate racemase/muconate lactonizing enzyme family protein [Thioalkalivibrio sp. HK1]